MESHDDIQEKHLHLHPGGLTQSTRLVLRVIEQTWDACLSRFNMVIPEKNMTTTCARNPSPVKQAVADDKNAPTYCWLGIHRSLERIPTVTD
eukprot:4085261-Amphidinium_carterae.1